MTPGRPARRAVNPSRVIVADDDLGILETIRLILKTDQYEIDVARSPAAVLSSLSGGSYDAVLIDLNSLLSKLAS